MKLPKSIKQKLISANNHAISIGRIMDGVNSWLENKGFSPEDLRSGNGKSLEEFEYGSENVEELIELFEEYLTELENKTTV